MLRLQLGLEALDTLEGKESIPGMLRQIQAKSERRRK